MAATGGPTQPFAWTQLFPSLLPPSLPFSFFLTSPVPNPHVKAYLLLHYIQHLNRQHKLARYLSFSIRQP